MLLLGRFFAKNRILQYDPRGIYGPHSCLDRYLTSGSVSSFWQALWRMRLALSVAMFPRGQIGSGVLLIAICYGISGLVVCPVGFQPGIKSYFNRRIYRVDNLTCQGRRIIVYNLLDI